MILRVEVTNDVSLLSLMRAGAKWVHGYIPSPQAIVLTMEADTASVEKIRAVFGVLNVVEDPPSTGVDRA